MKSKILTPIIIIVVLVIAYFAYNGSNKNADLVDRGTNTAANTNTVQGTTDTNTRNPAPAATSKKMAFAEFLKQNNASYTCTVTEAMSDFPNKGTIHIVGAADKTKIRMQGEFEIVVERKTVKSYMIMKDGYSYSWSSMMPTQGVKIKLVVDNTDPKNPTYNWNADQIGDYDCKPWTVDESIFALPSSVTFREIKTQ